MLEIDELASGGYRGELGISEVGVVREIAGAFGFSESTALASIINRGMDSIGKQVREIRASDKDRCEGG